jgi:hypothetical protein
MTTKRGAKPSRGAAAESGRKTTRSAKPSAKKAPARAVRKGPSQPAVRSRGVLRVTIAATAVLLALSAFIAGALVGRDSTAGLELKPGVPTLASVGDLRAYASPERPVYWIGPARGGALEVTRASAKAIYVRYLHPGVEVGDPRAEYTTIGTYFVPQAYSTLVRAARARGAMHTSGPEGALVFWRSAQPTSVYLAYRGSDYLVEVYDPSPRRARLLALGGRVRPLA